MQVDIKKDFGAKPDGKTNNAGSIDAAIGECYYRGGGTVYIPPGTYLTGTIHMKSNVTLHLSRGAILKCADDDFIDEIEDINFDPHADIETTYFNCALIRCDEIDNFSIEGGGTLDGNRGRRGGPKPISVRKSSRITIRDINIVNAPNYAMSFIDSEHINLDNVKIEGAMSDGIDLDGCRFATISNCKVDSWDDAICLKASPALGEIIDVANVVVMNCTVTTGCNCFKLGTESSGDFTNVAISNCAFYPKPFVRQPISGIALESVDGSNINRVTATNIVMESIECPIFLRLGKRGRAQAEPTAGTVEDVCISNIISTGATMPIIIAGIPNHHVKNVKLRDIIVNYGIIPPENVHPGIKIKDVPEAVEGYPDPHMFGPVPSWALFFRHARDITCSGLNIKAEGRSSGATPVLASDTVLLNLEGCRISQDTQIKEGRNACAVYLDKSSDIKVFNCRFNTECDRFIEIDDNDTERVTEWNNFS